MGHLGRGRSRQKRHRLFRRQPFLPSQEPLAIILARRVRAVSSPDETDPGRRWMRAGIPLRLDGGGLATLRRCNINAELREDVRRGVRPVCYCPAEPCRALRGSGGLRSPSLCQETRQSRARAAPRLCFSLGRLQRPADNAGYLRFGLSKPGPASGLQHTLPGRRKGAKTPQDNRRGKPCSQSGTGALLMAP